MEILLWPYNSYLFTCSFQDHLKYERVSRTRMVQLSLVQHLWSLGWLHVPCEAEESQTLPDSDDYQWRRVLHRKKSTV